MTRLLVSDEVLDDWHPLSGLPAPEYIPPEWDGPHVGKRLAEALRTLSRTSIRNGSPSAFGNSWPEYQIEWTDQLARLEGDQEQQAQDAAAKNWTRVIPTSIEIAQMETAIVWPGRYLCELPQLLRVVGAVAQGKAHHRPLAWVAGRLNFPGRHIRRWNNEGLDLIAEGLIRDSVAVQDDNRSEHGARTISWLASELYRLDSGSSASELRINVSIDFTHQRGHGAPVGGDDMARSAVLPDLPSVSEFIPDYEASAVWGLGAPRNTPVELIDRARIHPTDLDSHPCRLAAGRGVADEGRRNWTRVVPTSIEIARLETAISWPGHYLGDMPQLLRVVAAVANVKALYGDIRGPLASSGCLAD
jgi:hypothetical protein